MEQGPRGSALHPWERILNEIQVYPVPHTDHCLLGCWLCPQTLPILSLTKSSHLLCPVIQLVSPSKPLGQASACQVPRIGPVLVESRCSCLQVESCRSLTPLRKKNPEPLSLRLVTLRTHQSPTCGPTGRCRLSQKRGHWVTRGWDRGKRGTGCTSRIA